MSEIIDSLKYRADVEASPVVQKARQHLRSLQSQAEAARVAHDDAVGVELEGGEGSTTARTTAKRRVDALESEVEAAEHALRVAERRAVEKAHRAYTSDVQRQWADVAKAAEKRAKVAEKIEGTLAELSALYREAAAHADEMVRLARDATPGGLPSHATSKMGHESLLYAIRLHATRHGVGLAVWPHGQHTIPRLAEHVREGNVVLLQHRPPAG